MFQHLHKILRLLPLLLLNCCGPAYLVPKWNPTFYQGSYEDKAIVRKQAGQKISCDDPNFNLYTCMLTDPDLLSIKTDIIDKCQTWKPGTELVDPLASSSADNVKIISKAIDKMPANKRADVFATTK